MVTARFVSEPGEHFVRKFQKCVFSVPPSLLGANVVAFRQRQSASVYLKKLCDIGVLEERRAGWEKLFINPAFLRLLTEANG